MASEATFAQIEGVESLRYSDDRDEKKETEMRQNNMIVYLSDKIDLESAAGNASFVYELCNDV